MGAGNHDGGADTVLPQIGEMLLCRASDSGARRLNGLQVG